MNSTPNYMVEGEHDEVMTVRKGTKQLQQDTFTSDDPLLSSAQCQVTTPVTKKKVIPILDSQIFSNQNEKDIDNYDDQALIKFLVNTDEDNFESGKLQNEHTFQQNHQSIVKSWNVDNNPQIKDITKVNGTNEDHLQNKEDIDEEEVLECLETPTYNSVNEQAQQNLETSAETTIVLTSAEIYQIEDAQVDPSHNLAHAQIVLTPSTAIQNLPQIFVNSGNTTQISDGQIIPVKNTVMLPPQPCHVQKPPTQVYSRPDAVAKTAATTASAAVAASFAAKSAVHVEKSLQATTTQYFNRPVNTNNARKISNSTQKRSHEEVNDNKDKDFQLTKKGKMNDSNPNKKIKKWEIKEEMKDPVEEQKRLNAKKAHDHRMKAKREKEAMQEKIKTLEQRVKDLETNNRVLTAENNLLKQFTIKAN